MSCERIEQVHAYYDGEMALSQRRELEAHLNECGECRELLAQLRRVSELIASAPLTQLPPAAMTRFEQTWFAAAQERGVMRIASWLTAAAAAVLIGALLVWPAGQRRDDSLRASTTAWPAAVMPPAESHEGDVASAELVGAAQWIVNDLSNEQSR